ncbi:MAG: hypothetical protein A3H96_04610 [Acidobacteria bacterium RIFCSPLOWO2_02_FULL_67_36]|nr:MAG: hypothetical protein A3H96_04610 [Acidobacteria bacterium RIFCSPLOWO2_02_FULL_67_36]OFW24244.1 MAG: hypothetical protein A3G21_12315 [Acidobacteria bacterium RIFCSPLOWO2_12_FULL_66_21]
MPFVIRRPNHQRANTVVPGHNTKALTVAALKTSRRLVPRGACTGDRRDRMIQDGYSYSAPGRTRKRRSAP